MTVAQARGGEHGQGGVVFGGAVGVGGRPCARPDGERHPRLGAVQEAGVLARESSKCAMPRSGGHQAQLTGA
ncbi:hypothetical protein ACFOSC_27530 [Streptantibioticus rubrisoli]|uniref:Uncharacterized protein n=1 Tax=Streptantibioticus rubrisoli TaxID=1387313 RepID=A0ABT1PI93_9ACTN|nr:hypothetical protein [Streptantibioticus rubrisoli]MCQ4043963.1 hypothetical protein [Streptantibioticus rubrisoli]